MNKNEVRIGNIVQFKNNKNNLTTITESCFEGNYIEKTYQGCKLDESILQRFNIEQNENKDYIFNSGRYVIIEMQNAYTLFLGKIEGADNTIELLTGFIYVHELQNLYFALTRKELSLSVC